jgi:hypothetical protein
MKQLKQSFFIGFYVVFLFAHIARPGTVGKIVGYVVDAVTNKPLPGCNVIIDGTTLGAAADEDGYFFIVNVPPGTYKVTARMMGYQVTTQTNVRVVIDLTTNINFKLSGEALKGETVQVVAERPMVEKDVTVKKMVMSAQEIRTTPVQNLTDMLTLQAGVVNIEYQTYGIPGFGERGIEQIHVRGGRANEIGFIFDGMAIVNPTYGGIGLGTRLNKFAVEEMTTETGVFNAEHGGALSQVVNWVTRTGDFEKYEGIFRYRTSEIGGKMIDSNSFLYPDRLQGLRDFAGAFGGPVPFLKNKVSFFVSGETSLERNRVLEFDDNIWVSGPLPGNNPYNTLTNYAPPYNPNDPDNHSDPLDQTAGWMALGMESTTDLYAKLAWRIKPNMNLVYSNWIVDGMTKFYGNDFESVIFRYYERGKNYTIVNSDRQYLEWRHQVLKSTFYTLRLSRFWQSRRYRVKNVDSDGDGYSDWLETRLSTNPYSADAKGDNAIPLDTDGDGYPDDVENNLSLLRSDLTNPILSDAAATDPNIYPNPNIYPLDNEWLLPWQYNGWIGVSPYYDFIMEGSGRYYHYSYTDTYEARLDITSQVNKHHQLQFGVNGKYHQLYFNEVQLPWLQQPYTDYYRKFPREGAAYLQDKIEYPYMTINLGIRLDAFNYNTTAWEDPNDPNSPLVRTKTHYKWGPRIGISHVITDRATFTFGYGIYHQLPIYRNIYVNSQRDLSTLLPIVGNPLVSAQKLTAYEFGVNNQLSDEWVVGIVGWSKEYGELDATERVPAFPFSYTISKGIDFGTARGVDLSVEKRALKDNLAGRLTYTYSVAKQNRADPWEGYRNTDTPETMPKRELLMSWDRTHDFSMFFGYLISKGPGFFGLTPLSNVRVDVVYFVQSGAPYTPTVEGIPQETNSERMPWIYQINLGVQKIVNIAGLKYKFGFSIENLLDRKNVIDVYNETGKPDDPGRRANNRILAGQNSDTVYDAPYFYGPRRSIQFTTEIEF